jgi:excisionase family DNA binding protein
MNDKGLPSPRLLKVGEVARRLSVSRSYVYQLLEKDRIRCSRIGKAVRVDAKWLDQWVDSGCPTGGVGA